MHPAIALTDAGCETAIEAECRSSEVLVSQFHVSLTRLPSCMLTLAWACEHHV